MTIDSYRTGQLMLKDVEQLEELITRAETLVINLRSDAPDTTSLHLYNGTAPVIEIPGKFSKQGFTPVDYLAMSIKHWEEKRSALLKAFEKL